MKKYVILVTVLLLVGACFVWGESKISKKVSLIENTDNDLVLNTEMVDKKEESKKEEVIKDDIVSDNNISNNNSEGIKSTISDSKVNESSNIATNENNKVVSSENDEKNEELDVEVIEVDSSSISDSKSDVSSNSMIEVFPSVSEKVTINDVDGEYFTIEVDSSKFEDSTFNSNNQTSDSSNGSVINDSSLNNSSTLDNSSSSISNSTVSDNNVRDEIVHDEEKIESETESKLEEDKLMEDKTMYSSEYIKLNKELKYLEYKNTYKLKATLKGISGNVVWSTSNEKIAKVDQSGKVTATGGGMAIITASVGKEKASCKVIAIRNTFKKLDGNPYRTMATVYYNGDEKITYYFRRQSYNTACSSEKVDGKQICTSGFRTWLAGHGCGTIATTAVVNAYLGNNKDNLISAAKMRMYYEKEEYNWKCSSADPYCNRTVFQLTRNRVADVLNNQFDLKAKAYVIESKTGNEKHIERITNALAEGRPVVIFVNAGQAGTTKFTTQNHTLVMVGFADEDGNVLVLDSSHNGFKEDTVDKMVNQYIGRGSSNYRGYIVLNETKS